MATSVALAALTLTGCGDSGESPDAAPNSQLSLDSSEDPNTELPEGVPTEAPEEPSGLGFTLAEAKKYAEHAFRMFQFSAQTRDLSPLLALGNCPSCDWIRDAIAEMKRGKYFEVPAKPATVHSVALLHREGPKILLGVSYSLHQGEKVAEAGTVLNKLNSASRKYMEVAVLWTEGSWKLLDLAITE